MNLLNRFSRILVALLITATSAVAQGPDDLQELILTGDLNGRSSLDFRKNARNVKYLIPEGSEGTVLETRKLSRTGSYGIKVRITKVAEGHNNKGTLPKVGDETWVYFSQKDPWLTFKDKEGSEVQDPEIALTSRAKREGGGIPSEGTEDAHLPTKEEVLREQKPVKSTDPNLTKVDDPKKTEGDFCATCSTSQPGVADKNRSDIRDVKTEVEKAANPKIPDPKWAKFPGVARYSLSEEAEASIKYGMRNKERRSKKLCYRYVKRALLGGDLVDDYLPGSKARYGVGDLKRRGFINMLEDPRYKGLIKSPKDAPKGAVLIYRNTRDRNHAGHAEIKTDWGTKGGYVSDFFRTDKQPIPNRELIGVMIKERP
ncbi:hypothetical protein [Bdellovibrio sp. HCB-162]|uniref:hypothetical protein n=1 Tax=Bdellovibrio sp. HCB-162 TaxID=3394234 RepID=UPI0039BCE36E